MLQVPSGGEGGRRGGTPVRTTTGVPLPSPLPFPAPPFPWPWWGQGHPSHSPPRTKTGVSPPPILIWPGRGVPTLDGGGTYLGWGKGTYLGYPPPILTRLGERVSTLDRGYLHWGTPSPWVCTDRHLWKQYLPVVLRPRALKMRSKIYFRFQNS